MFKVARGGFYLRTVATVTLMSVAAIHLTGCEDQKKIEAAAAEKKQREEAELQEKYRVNLQKDRDACTKSLDKIRTLYDSHMRAGRYWTAAGEVRGCAGSLDDATLKKLLADAEIKEHLSVINNSKARPKDRADAIEMLLRDYPDQGKKFQPQLAKLRAAGESQAAADAAAVKYQHGVRIGMSKADALASSWGRPERVHTTTTARGVSEQWVYGGGNYLYFENGVLVSIQN